VTPYTAYLVVEERTQLAAAGRAPASSHSYFYDLADADGETAKTLDEARLYSRAEAGSVAVRGSTEALGLQIASFGAPAHLSLDSRNNASGASPIRTVGAKVFGLVEGRWIDTEYDGKAETKKIKALSDEYFKLLREKPGLKRYFALGSKVVVMLDSVVYETVE